MKFHFTNKIDIIFIKTPRKIRKRFKCIIFSTIITIVLFYDNYFVAGFGTIFFSRIRKSSIQVWKHLEKPLDFDPFGQTGLSPLATI